MEGTHLAGSVLLRNLVTMGSAALDGAADGRTRP